VGDPFFAGPKTDSNMHTVLLTVHSLIVVFLIVLVLLQRSDGGALGIGGGGGGFMTSRGAANVLTRTTSILAALFFATSILLAITAGGVEKDADIIQDLTGETVVDPNAPLSTQDLLNTLGSGNPETGASPESQTESPPTSDEAPEAQTSPDPVEPE
jgi:preprotein translocase subunit SecG